MESAGVPVYALIVVLAGATYIFWRCLSLWRAAPDASAGAHDPLSDDVVLLD